MTSLRNTSARVRRPSFRPRCEPLEDRTAPAVHTWTGAVNTLWSNAGNWIGGSPGSDPSATLVFPAAATRYTSLNDSSPLFGAAVQGITIQGTGYNISGSLIILGAAGITASNTTGSNTIDSTVLPWNSSYRTVTVTSVLATLNLTGTLRDTRGDALHLTKAGAGTLTLSGNNIYSGGTDLNAGTLAVGSNTALGTGRFNLNGGDLRASTPVTLANPFAVIDSTFSSSVAGNQNLTLTGAGLLLYRLSTANTAGNLVFTGPLSGSSGLVKTGAGALGLVGNNSYMGGTYLNAGSLTVGTSTALGSGRLNFNGGAFQASAPVTLANPFTIAGPNDFQGFAGMTFTGAGTLSVALRTSNASVTTLQFNGPLNGPGGVIVDGPGTVVLANPTSSYAGPTLVNGGTLRLGANNAIPATSQMSMTRVLPESRFDLAGYRQVLGSLSGNGDVTLGTNFFGLTVGTLNTSTTFSGTISGAGRVTKQGTGTWTVTGGPYNVERTTVAAGTQDLRTTAVTDSFDVTGGTVLVGAAGLVSATGNYVQTGGRTTLDGGGILAPLVDVQNGVLDGTGYIVGNLRNDGRVDIGYLGTAGYLLVLGNYTQTAGGMLNVELGGPDILTQYDLLFVEGTTTLAGTLNVGRFGGYLPPPDAYFLAILSGGQTSGTFGTMTGLPLGGGRELLPLYFDNGLLLYAT